MGGKLVDRHVMSGSESAATDPTRNLQAGRDIQLPHMELRSNRLIDGFRQKEHERDGGGGVQER